MSPKKKFSKKFKKIQKKKKLEKNKYTHIKLNLKKLK